MKWFPNKYKVWDKILQKHEEKYEKEKTFNLNTLYSNQKQIDNELRKGRITPEEYKNLTDRYKTLKARIAKEQGI